MTDRAGLSYISKSWNADRKPAAMVILSRSAAFSELYKEGCGTLKALIVARRTDLAAQTIREIRRSALASTWAS
jgi:hypothetical protein